VQTISNIIGQDWVIKYNTSRLGLSNTYISVLADLRNSSILESNCLYLKHNFLSTIPNLRDLSYLGIHTTQSTSILNNNSTNIFI